MVSIHAGRVRLLSARSTPRSAVPESILLVSLCPALGCADARVRFGVTFDPDGVFSRDTSTIGARSSVSQSSAPGMFGPYLWDAGTIVDLGPGNMGAIDINDHGQILLQGFLADPDGSNSCFLRDGDATIELGNPGGTQCFATDLNKSRSTAWVPLH
jgi:hypothetical protein